MRDKHQKSDNLSKMTKFYDRLEQRQANQTEIRKRFSSLDKDTFEALQPPLMSRLKNSGHLMPAYPELPEENIAEI